jgi:hypothetical protein
MSTTLVSPRQPIIKVLGFRNLMGVSGWTRHHILGAPATNAK